MDPRIYRAAFVPVLFALILLAFSLENRPRSLKTTLAPDAFEGSTAFADAFGRGGRGGLADRFPNRRPGSAGDEQLARVIASRMEGTPGFRVRSEVRDGETIDGTRRLRTVIAERAGTVDERIAVIAHRDAAGRRAAAELSGTAALLELARVFGAPRRTRRTLVLASTSAGSGGAAGAAALADELGGPVAAVLVLGDLASSKVRPPFVNPWSNALGASALRLRATLQEAVRSETGTGAGPPRAMTQFIRHALPATYGEQGVLLSKRIPAVLLSVGGDRPPAADAPISRERLQAFGRVALRTVTALDGAPSERALGAETTSSDLVTNRKVVPGWAIRLFTGALLLPPLLAAVDGFAAVRRHRGRVLTWLRWTLAWALPFVLAALFAILLRLTGLLSAAPGAPTSPRALPVEIPALLAVALVFVLAWAWLRPGVMRLVRAGGDLAEPGAGSMVMLVALVTTIAVWVGNPYAAALVIPAMHAGLFAVASELRRATRLGAVAVGMLPFAVVAIALSHALGLGLLDAIWLGLLLVAGGHVSLLSVLLWSLLAGCAAGALRIAARPDAGDEAISITVRGPRTYAGPGSLGGTESALRR
ncbi:MAG: M28 family peptidase [Actinomycetota bacterium]|nr:M28 family peptidase [Actinomycetota bacterium]